MAQRRQRRADEDEEENEQATAGMGDEVEGEEQADAAATEISVASQINTADAAAEGAEEDNAAVELERTSTTPDAGVQNADDATVERAESQADERWAQQQHTVVAVGAVAGEAVVQQPEPVLGVAVEDVVVMPTDAPLTGHTDALPPLLLSAMTMTNASDSTSSSSNVDPSSSSSSAVEVTTTVAPTAAKRRHRSLR